MQATATTAPVPADLPAACPIVLPGTPAAHATPSSVTREAVAAAFAPEIAVLQRCAAWEQIVVEDESSFDSI